MKIKRFTIVLISWEDAWAKQEDGVDSLVHYTTGFLLRKTKTHVTLVQNYYENETDKITNNYFCIPKGCITKITSLKKPIKT